MIRKGVLTRTSSLEEANRNNIKLFAFVLMPNFIKLGTSVSNATKTAASMTNKTLPELQAIAKQNAKLFRELFGVNKEGAEAVLNNIENVKIPEGLTREAMM